MRLDDAEDDALCRVCGRAATEHPWACLGVCSSACYEMFRWGFTIPRTEGSNEAYDGTNTN